MQKRLVGRGTEGGVKGPMKVHADCVEGFDEAWGRQNELGEG